ncbi:unnamed protein product [Cladocopium goreaui]|uniref:Uncharacterized protein n=1 Tax=Cladocopium goreaui TaxID=2562237 RepID=A0A9P1DVN3_9DINO|nr:unnamed protein product [Cladocopium goreaui]
MTEHYGGFLHPGKRKGRCCKAVAPCRAQRRPSPHEEKTKGAIAGHSPDLPDEELSTPLHLAAEEGYLEVVKCLVEEIHGNTPLLLAAKEGREDVVEYFLAKAKLQAPHKANYEGETPLLGAVQKGRRNIVKVLLLHNRSVKLRWCKACWKGKRSP